MEALKPFVILTGPTAVGKTEISLKLAKEIGGEIISADSMQVYRYMDIGSAKIDRESRNRIPHHLIDVLDPKEEFNVYRFQQMAKEALTGIYERGNIPVIVGGTGFYIQALLYDVDFETEDEADEIRFRLTALAKENGNAYLHEKLTEVDPVSAMEIHQNNVKRVIRALEFYEKNHFPISEHNQIQRQKESEYNFCYFVLNDDRTKLYERIDTRVGQMLADGLLEEVRRLKEMGCDKSMVSMQGLGYKELLSYLSGEIDYEQAVYLIKRDSRRFAKRQITWFRREKDVQWMNRQAFNGEDEMIAYMLETMRRKGLIK